MTTMHLTNIMIHTGGYWCRRLPIGWQMLGSPIYDGQIRVIYVHYLLLSCMPVYMLLYDGHIRVIYVDYLLLSCMPVYMLLYDGHIRVIYVDYLLLSCMPVYMLLYVC